MRNLIISAALVAASLFGMTAQAAEKPAAPYVELSNPVPVAVPGKIEVVELFWYGCPHCYAFEPVINPWVEKLPSGTHTARCS
jgi:thiol:disulfide interchange protein DsbA